MNRALIGCGISLVRQFTVQVRFLLRSAPILVLEFTEQVHFLLRQSAFGDSSFVSLLLHLSYASLPISDSFFVLSRPLSGEPLVFVGQLFRRCSFCLLYTSDAADE